MGGEAGEHRQHQPARCRGRIELFGHAANPHAVLFQLRNGIQDQAGVAAEPVQLVNKELIEFPAAGVL